jgi:cytosine/adenosine deaminase-related metal-dependent hydrolase
MRAREVLEVATGGGARVLGRTDIGSLEPGKCADFFTLDLNSVNFAGGLSDPMAATRFCTPVQACHTVVNGRSIVRNGEVVTVDLPAVIAEHNRPVAGAGTSAFTFGWLQGDTSRTWF